MNRPAARTRPAPHYAWIIVAVGTLVVFASIGLGRFALGMLLPSMGSSLDLSYSEMGYIGTGNFVGYLVSVATIGLIARRYPSRALIPASLALVSLSLVAVSGARSFAAVLAFYFLCGIGSGGANVLVMSSVAHWFRRDRRGAAAGLMTSGSGLGMVMVGWLAPWINTVSGPEGWRTNWFILGLVSFAAAVVCLLLFRDNPRDAGTTPLGGAAPPPASQDRPAGRRTLVLHLGAVYLLFGFAYVIYMTFLVTTLVDERGFPESTAGYFWSVFGLLSLVSGPIFGALSDRIGRRRGLMIAFAVHCAAYLCVAGNLPPVFLYFSVLLLGTSAWGVPAMLTAAVGDGLDPARAAAAFGMITLAFSVGQLVGPAAAGVLADLTGSFSAAYLLAGGLAAAALLVSAALPRD